MNVPTHGTDHGEERRGSTLGRERRIVFLLLFLLVAFRSWYKYKRESVHGSASCRTWWLLEGNYSARARHEFPDHSPYCETARGVQDFQLTVRLRKSCRCFSLRDLVGRSESIVYCIAVEKEEKNQRLPSLQNLIRRLQLF